MGVVTVTPNGWSVLAVTAGAAGMWAAGSGGAGIVAMVGLALVLYAVWWRLAQPRDGVVSLSVAAAEVRRGEPVAVRVSVDQAPRRRGGLISARVELFGTLRQIPVPASAASVRWDEIAARRGVYQARALGAERVGPLWLTRRGVAASGLATITTVLPKLYPFAMDSVLAHADEDGIGGTAPGGRVFSALRDYADGDDVRLIHWTSSARRPAGEYVVRQNVLAKVCRSTILLDTDTDTDTDQGTEWFETAVDIAYSLAHSASLVPGADIVLLTTEHGMVSRHRGFTAIERALASIEPCAAHPSGEPVSCLDTLMAACPRAGQPSVTIVVSAAPGPAEPRLSVRKGDRALIVRVGRHARPPRPAGPATTVVEVTGLVEASRAWAGMTGS